MNSDDEVSNSCDGAEITLGIDGESCTPVVIRSVDMMREPKTKEKPGKENCFTGYASLMLLPCQIKSNHWGLIVFDLPVEKIFYNDGFHMELLSMFLNCCLKVLQTCFENSCCERLNTSKWKALSLEKVGIPDQPHSGTGSAGCGIGFLAARDFPQGVRTFGWTLQEAPHYRRRFIVATHMISHDGTTS